MEGGGREERKRGYRDGVEGEEEMHSPSFSFFFNFNFDYFYFVLKGGGMRSESAQIGGE